MRCFSYGAHPERLNSDGIHAIEIIMDGPSGPEKLNSLWKDGQYGRDGARRNSI